MEVKPSKYSKKYILGYRLLTALIFSFIFATPSYSQVKPKAFEQKRRVNPIHRDPHKYFRNEILYQVVLDRFFDGNPANNVFDDDPKGLYDRNREAMTSRFGGDIEGLIKKLDYLKDLGVTMIWVSPVFQNADDPIPEEKGGQILYNTNYHGYWIEDWYEVDRHLKNEGEGGFAPVKRLVDEAGARGIKVVLDTVINHSSEYDISGGRIFKNGRFVIDRDLDLKLPVGKRWYHHRGNIPLDWNVNDVPWGNDDTTYMYRLANLSDLNSDGNEKVRKYLLDAHVGLLKSGVSGFRLDTVPYVHPSVISWFENELRAERGDIALVGEWFGGGPTMVKSMAFYSKTGYSMFDFQLRWAFQKAFLGDEHYGYRTFNYLLDEVSQGFKTMEKSGLDPNDMVNFVDNHDLPRLRDLGASREGIEAAIAMLFAMPGIPCLYYGIEQDLFDGQERMGMGGIGGDPYNRSMMWDDNGRLIKEDGKLYKKVKELVALRKNYPLFRYGKFENLDGQLGRSTASNRWAIFVKCTSLCECGRDTVYGFAREDSKQVAFYITNVSGSKAKVEMNLERMGIEGASLVKMAYPDRRYEAFNGLKNQFKNADARSVRFEMDVFDYVILIFDKAFASKKDRD